jgi:hypothetical protein
MHSAIDHDCTLNDRFGKPSCMTEFEQEIREDERERAVQRVEAIADDPNSGVDWNWDYDIDPTGMTRNPLVWIREAVAAIKNEGQ